ncbi:MAG: chorismate-binding protein, partial [Bacteroidota bacterium]
MKKYNIKSISENILADTITPVSIYLKVRDIFPNSLLLEGSDYHGQKNSFSFICLQPISNFKLEAGRIEIEDFISKDKEVISMEQGINVPEKLNEYLHSFHVEEDLNESGINGIFGYCSYDAVQYFEDIKFKSPKGDKDAIPDIMYSFFKYIIVINHFKNTLYVVENIFDGQESSIENVTSLLYNRNFATYSFYSKDSESSNKTDEEYMKMVSRGKEHCKRGDVFQIVLSRQFSRPFEGDDFNVYRSLRSINPSPYLFYFDYGS